MAEGKETALRVVAAHAGVANSAKRDVAVGDVHDGVVDACSAGGCTANHVPGIGLFPEIVEGKGFFAGVHKVHYFGLVTES